MRHTPIPKEIKSRFRNISLVISILQDKEVKVQNDKQELYR